LVGNDRLKISLDLAGINCPRHKLEGHLDPPAGHNRPRIDFVDLALMSVSKRVDQLPRGSNEAKDALKLLKEFRETLRRGKEHRKFILRELPGEFG